MDYLTQLIEVGDRLDKWEVKDAILADYIKTDSKRLADWRSEGEKISEMVFNSSLPYEDKSSRLSRIKNSYSLVDYQLQNPIFNYQFGLGILAGLFLSYILNSTFNSFTEAVSKGVRNELQTGER